MNNSTSLGLSRTQFIDDLNARGMSPDEIAEKVKAAEKKGLLIKDDELEKSPPFERQLSFYTEDIPEIVSGLSQRAEERAYRIGRPTVQGNIAEQTMQKIGAPRALTEIAEYGSSIPERGTRTAGLFFGTLADVYGALGEMFIKGIRKSPVVGPMSDIAVDLVGKGTLFLGHAVNWMLGGAPKNIIDQYGPDIKSAVGKIVKSFQDLPQEDRDNWASLLDVFSFIPEVKAYKLGSGAQKALGRKIEKTGETWLTKQMQVPETILQKVPGKTKLARSRKLSGDIMSIHKKPPLLPRLRQKLPFGGKTDVPKIKGGFENIGLRADIIAKKASDKANDLLMTVAKQKNPEIDLSQAFQAAYDYAESMSPGKGKKRAIKIAQDLVDAFSEEGFAGVKGIEDAIKLKRRLKDGMDVYKYGATISQKDAIEIALRKKISNTLIDQLEQYSPRAATLNRMARDFWNVADAAFESAYKLEKAPIALKRPSTYFKGLQGTGPRWASELGRDIQSGSFPYINVGGPVAVGGVYMGAKEAGTRLKNIGRVPTRITVPEEEEREIPLSQLGPTRITVPEEEEREIPLSQLGR